MGRKITEVERIMLKKLQKISDEDDFLYSFVVYLKTDEERKFVIDVLNKGIIKEPSEATILAINILNARKASNGNGNYLKGIEIVTAN